MSNNIKKPPIKKCRPKGSHLVAQSNMLIEAIYQVSLNAKKLIACAISQIHPDDKDFKFYMIPVEKFKKLAGITSKMNYYKILKLAVVELRSKSFDIFNLKDESYYNVPFIVEGKYDPKNKLIGFNFSPRLKPFLLELKKQGYFTQYELGNVMKMRSVYSIRLYELLKQYEKDKIKKFDLDELRIKLGIERDKLSRYHDFKIGVLEHCKKELLEKSNIKYTYKPIKKVRAVKWIEFNIKKNKKAFISDNRGKDIDVTDIVYKKDISKEVLKFIPDKFKTNNDVIRDVADFTKSHGIEYVIQKASYAATKAKNFKSYFHTSLENDHGAEHTPNHIDLSIISKPGMQIIYKNKEYTIDESGCIFLSNGNVLATGQLNKMIEDGKIKIKSETE